MTRVGLFGKMPAVGDFVSRGFTPGTIQGLDRFFQRVMVSVRGADRDLYALFDAAPAYAMSVRPGALAAAGLSLVVLPSVDRVGRLFPFCAGVEWGDLESAGRPLGFLDAGLSGEIFTILLERVFETRWGPDDVLAALIEGPCADLGVSTGIDMRHLLDAARDSVPPEGVVPGKHHWFEGSEVNMQQIPKILCEHLLPQVDAVGTVLDAGGAVVASFVTSDLSDAVPLGALLDADWKNRGWNIHPMAPPSRDSA